ncbi:uncharacterized protein LOC128549833 [Mercenaria mercenaria]|uniref:uncharacterized protein LOC128549833 n=1 Tax=Mercenaria mercenaria TaxID=6596 RepID=UPI00234F215D|nr:uncharacterized protein LOC128549833 [Mercenaria mercenaria]
MSSSLIDEDSFYERFFHRGQYGLSGGWPHSTTLLYRMRIKKAGKNNIKKNRLLHKSGCSSLPQCERWTKVENDAGGRHAEMLFVQQVNELLDCLNEEESQQTYRQISFDIVLSYSPCSDCAKELTQLKRRSIEPTPSGYNVIFCTMNIKFAKFYEHYVFENIEAMIWMVQNQIEFSVFNGLCDWKDFLDNIVKLALDIQSEAFYATWFYRQDRELVDSILLECIKLTAFKWPTQDNEGREEMKKRICDLKSAKSSFAYLMDLRAF